MYTQPLRAKFGSAVRPSSPSSATAPLLYFRLTGIVASVLYAFPVVVRLADAYRETPDAIGRLLISAPNGARVMLSQVAQVRLVEGPELITHEDGERMVIVQSNVRGRDLGGYAADVQREVTRRVQLPEGYFVTYGGQFENQERAMGRLRRWAAPPFSSKACRR